MAAAPPPRPPRQRSGAEANNGNSNDAPTSRQLDFYQAMSDFRHMFPNMDEEVIEAVLRANNGAVDETIDQLLTMNIDEKQDESAAETLPQPQTVRLTDPGSSTTDPQEQTESSDSESIDLVDDISRSPEVNIAIPRPRPRVSRDPETTVPKNNDAVHNATNMLSQSSVDRGDLDFIGSSSVRINPQSNINEQFSSSSSAQTPSVQSKSPSNWGGDMLLDFSDPIEEIGATAFEPGKEHSAKPDSLRNVVENDLSPVNSESSAPAMPPKMLLLGNRRYASSTHWSPQKPPLEQQWRKWDPPMLGDLPDDFLRITFQPPLPRHRSNVHSDFYGPEHVNKSQLAGRGLVLTTDDVNHNTRHRYPVDDSMMTSSGSSRPHRVPPSRSQSMRTPSQHHSKTLDGSSRASKRSSLGAPPTSSCTFNSGAMPIRSVSPAGLHSDSLINDPTSTAAKTRTWSPIRGKHKPKQPLPSQHADHHHHHLMGSTPPTPTSTANHGHHIPHSATRSTNHTTTRSTSHINDSTSHQNSTPSSGSHRSNPSQHAAQHAAAQQQALDSRVLQQRIVENARKRSAVSSNTNPEHVQYLEDEQLALMLQNDEFLAILMSDNDFVQALERDRMNATAFEPGPDSTVHADSCPLSNNPTPDSRFGDNGSLGSPVSSDEHMEFRRRLELMGGSSKTKFATIARKFFSRKKKKSPMKFKGPSLRSNIAPSTANLLEEDEDGELDHRDEVEDSSDERQQSY